MKITNSRSFLPRPQSLSKQVQAKALQSDVGKAMTTNAASLGRQTNKQQDQVELGQSPRELPKKPELSKAEKNEDAKTAELEAQDEPKPSKEELFEDLTSTLSDVLGDEQRGLMIRRAGERVTDEVGLEKALAKTARVEARGHLGRMRPGASEEQIREDAKSDEQLAGVLRVYDSAGAYLGVKKKERVSTEEGLSKEEADKLLKELSDRNEVMNKLRSGMEEMLNDNRKAFAEIHKIRQEANDHIAALWLEGYKRRAALQQKQFESFLALIRGVE